MESCTGGLFASVLTDVPGTMSVYRGGLVTYTTEMKIESGVPADVISEFGVVSPETAGAMARTVRERLGSDYGIGITGVAGPDSQDGVEPGTVHIAVADASGETHHMSMSMNQGRQAVKRRAVTTAMLLLRRTLLAE
jgi:PncC family amidohydrolase